MPYDAFISYSHSADQRLAAALERALQAFARPWNRRRALDIFRDEGNLNLSAHLWGSIQPGGSHACQRSLQETDRAAGGDAARARGRRLGR